jgi:hypothetical protein
VHCCGAPAEDQIMAGTTVMSFDHYICHNYAVESLENMDEDDEDKVEFACGNYPRWVEEQGYQAPLVIYQADKGGKFAYLGFVVSGDGIVY